MKSALSMLEEHTVRGSPWRLLFIRSALLREAPECPQKTESWKQNVEVPRNVETQTQKSFLLIKL